MSIVKSPSVSEQASGCSNHTSHSTNVSQINLNQVGYYIKRESIFSHICKVLCCCFFVKNNSEHVDWKSELSQCQVDPSAHTYPHHNDFDTGSASSYFDQFPYKKNET
ncbi:hypothetical protein D5R81_04560 [Parashewanella spongiae]|uniref:Uncharacterized protein n=1 Tax=Parashewanella spongiae TaxID=342950 RepID=A0A3A6U3E1_9GAMM|nr:hypothetical protein [Parashewanella spongiae]MCL1077326.1 hypothetical protein [Parashewanella spongiae]RJY18587.1 hypothetical protein D5R81_04560 [Parashewanella spongiae]